MPQRVANKYLLRRRITGSARPPGCVPHKIAVLTIDWKADDGFIKAGRGLGTSLTERGWDVRIVGESDVPLNGTTMKQHVWAHLTDVEECDQVLLAALGHGSKPFQIFSIHEGGTGALIRRLWNYGWALTYGELTSTEPFPFEDQAFFESHYVAVDPSENESGELYASDIVEIASELRDLGATVGVIDTSCNGGSTVRALESLEDPGVCAISLAPTLSPSGTGFKIGGADYMDGAVTMTDLADRISQHYYDRRESGFPTIEDRKTHNGFRVQSIGFRSGCEDLMPMRDAFYLAWDPNGTYYTTARERPSHALRDPKHFSRPTNAREPLPSRLDPHFLSGSGLTQNHYWKEQAYVRWFQEVADELYQGGTLDWPAWRAARRLHSATVSYREALTDLDCSLNGQWWECETTSSSMPEPGEGMTSSSYSYALDEAVRHSLSGSCICEVNPEQAAAWGIDCDEAQLVAGLPGAMPVTNCEDPTADVEAYLQTRPVAQARLDGFEAALDNVVNTAAVFETHLKRLEQACSSPACDAQDL